MFGSSPKMDDYLFNLKFSAKSMERQAKKCEKEQNKEKNKLKNALAKGDPEVAKIHAENAIRQKNQSLNYRRMAARIDAVASRVQSALTNKEVMKSMKGVVKGMEAAMKSMNLEQVSNVMDRFETQFENLDVQSQVMEGTMTGATTLSTPQGEVDALMKQVADESGLEISAQMPTAADSTLTPAAVSAKKEDDLTARLAQLRS